MGLPDRMESLVHLHWCTASLSNARPSWLCLTLSIRSPQGQIVTEQLHDERGIFVRVLAHIVELRNSILEGCASHLARLFRVRQHLILEDGIIQCQAKADGMCDCQILLCDILSILVGLTCLLCSTALLVTFRELGDITVVVSLHLLVEDLRLSVRRLGNQAVVQQRQDGITNLLKLCLHLLAILP